MQQPGSWKRTSWPSKAVRVSRGDEFNVNEFETSGSNCFSNKQGYENWWAKNIFWPKAFWVIPEPKLSATMVSEGDSLRLVCCFSQYLSLWQREAEQKGLTTWAIIFVRQKWEDLIHLTTVYWAPTESQLLHRVNIRGFPVSGDIVGNKTDPDPALWACSSETTSGHTSHR